jgi:hypothetical protein
MRGIVASSIRVGRPSVSLCAQGDLLIKRWSDMRAIGSSFIGVLALACVARGATIVLPKGAAPEEKQAAADLAHVWLKGAGEAASVVSEEPDSALPGRGDGSHREGSGGPWFFVGETEVARERAALPAGWDRDGFRVVVIEGAYAEGLNGGAEGGRAGRPAPPRSMSLPEHSVPPQSMSLPEHPAQTQSTALPIIILRGASGMGTEFAVAWFAQHEMGVRWFRPGEIGEVIPSLEGWRATALDRTLAPGFISREFSTLGPGTGDWARFNGLHGRLPHDHALLHVFPREEYDRHPEWFPKLRGQPAVDQKRGQVATCATGGASGTKCNLTPSDSVTSSDSALGVSGGASGTSSNLTPSDDLTPYRPKSDQDYNWQPNLALPEVAAHAAEVADEFFDRHPGEEGFSLSENDSVRFDQSKATIRARGPLRWFRGRPDYSDLVFGFMNRVADEVAVKHPDKLLGAYAYYWCEDAPGFWVRPNVLPWLTADRSEYFDPDFKREDHALIERWCRSGARVVGIYDYVEGAPYLIPRQTARLTAGSIQFAYRAGVRAYTAEGTPNWGLDGPKLWLAAQLLWDPGQSVDALLEEYYSGYWREAAPAMRRFDESCAQIWMSQPRPAEWIKYYQDEAQVALFPAGVCAKLREELDRAAGMARDPMVARRVEAVSEAFAVTERFSAFCDARNALSAAAVETEAECPEGRLSEMLREYQNDRLAFLASYEHAVSAGCMGRTNLLVYLRDDPGPTAVFRGTVGELAGFDDQDWTTLTQPGKLDDVTFAWSLDPWWGHGEPAEGRTIRVTSDRGGKVRLRFERCRSESLTQWIRSIPMSTYRAAVDFRGRVSPGDQVFLIMNCLDAGGGYAGREVIDQVPAGDWSAGRRLAVVIQAPENATEVGMSLYVTHQMPGDYAEFGGLRVERW